MKRDWEFNSFEPKEFENHIEKSIPGYREIHECITNFSEWFALDGSVIYDLGSSSGNLLKSIKEKNINRHLEMYGIDELENMYCEDNYSQEIQFIGEKISDVEFKKSNMIISCFTIQFMKKFERKKVYSKVYNSLQHGGAFFIAEKVSNKNSIISEIKKSLLLEFKVNNGLQPKDILDKDIKLRGVMNLDYESNIKKDLLEQGFSEVDTIYKNNEFTLICAIK